MERLVKKTQVNFTTRIISTLITFQRLVLDLFFCSSRYLLLQQLDKAVVNLYDNLTKAQGKRGEEFIKKKKEGLDLLKEAEKCYQVPFMRLCEFSRDFIVQFFTTINTHYTWNFKDSFSNDDNLSVEIQNRRYALTYMFYIFSTNPPLRTLS